MNGKFWLLQAKKNEFLDSVYFDILCLVSLSPYSFWSQPNWCTWIRCHNIENSIVSCSNLSRGFSNYTFEVVSQLLNVESSATEPKKLKICYDQKIQNMMMFRKVRHTFMKDKSKLQGFKYFPRIFLRHSECFFTICRTCSSLSNSSKGLTKIFSLLNSI